jgi:hypothetical protein
LVLHVGICKDGGCEQVLAELKKRQPKALRVALTPSDSRSYNGADHTISSHEPQELLNLLRSRFGDPRMPEEKPKKKPRA